MNLEFIVKEGGKTLLFSLDKVKASQATQEEGLLWIELVGLGFDFLFRTDILEVFSCQVVSHLVAMDNPWCIVDVGSIIQWNFDLVQGRSREARSCNNILIACDFLDNRIDEGRFANVGHTHYIDITAFAILFNLFHQVLDGTLVLGRGEDHIDRTHAFFVGSLHQPMGHLTVLDRLGQDVLFISDQKHIISCYKTRQARNDGTIKVKNIDYIDHEGITISYFMKKLEEIIICQMNVCDFIVVTETETALAIDFACFQALFKS